MEQQYRNLIQLLLDECSEFFFAFLSNVEKDSEREKKEKLEPLAKKRKQTDATVKFFYYYII